MAKPIRQQVRGDPWQRVAEVGVPAVTGEQLAQDQQRPPLADDVEGASECAELPVGTHGSNPN
jgi:hypothetical protein